MMPIAKTFKPLVDSISIIVRTASYRTAFPVFLVASVLVETCASTSFTSSDTFKSFFPKILRRRKILIYKKGSVTPAISCSGVNPESSKFLSTRTIAGTWVLNYFMY